MQTPAGPCQLAFLLLQAFSAQRNDLFREFIIPFRAPGPIAAYIHFAARPYSAVDQRSIAVPHSETWSGASDPSGGKQQVRGQEARESLRRRIAGAIM